MNEPPGISRASAGSGRGLLVGLPDGHAAILDSVQPWAQSGRRGVESLNVYTRSDLPSGKALRTSRHRRRAAGVTLNAAFAGIRRVPEPVNEPNNTYAPGSPERAELKARLKSMAAEKIEIPLIIGGREIRTGKTEKSVMPHDHGHVLAEYHLAGPEHIQQAIAAAAAARREWSAWPWEDRAAVLLRAAELLATTLAPDDQRRDDARAVEDGVPVGDRRRVGDDRLLALQRLLRAGALQRAADQRPRRVEPDGVPQPRGLHLRGLAVQLHRDRRQPDDRAGADGQHRRSGSRRRARC